jgi:hypothetical protein
LLNDKKPTGINHNAKSFLTKTNIAGTIIYKIPRYSIGLALGFLTLFEILQ